jgi:predicted nucleic acid-binding Zn ribbon protein
MAKRTSLRRPVAVKDLLKDLLKPADWQALEQRRLIRGVWDAVLPQALLSQTRLVDVRRKELWVEVSAPPYAQELQFLKPRILQELEKTLGVGIIRDIRLSVGEGFG